MASSRTTPASWRRCGSCSRRTTTRRARHGSSSSSATGIRASPPTRPTRWPRCRRCSSALRSAPSRSPGRHRPSASADAAPLQLDAAQRSAVAAALQLAAQRHRTTLPPLLDAALRTADAAALDQLLPTYLGAARDDTAALLRRRLARLAPTTLASRLPGLVGDDTSRQLRAAELLAELPPAEGAGTLQTLLATTPCPRVKLCCSRALLDAGADLAELAAFVPAPILELAARRRLEPRRFRSVRPTTHP